MNVVETWFVAVWGLCWCNFYYLAADKPQICISEAMRVLVSIQAFAKAHSLAAGSVSLWLGDNQVLPGHPACKTGQDGWPDLMGVP